MKPISMMGVAAAAAMLAASPVVAADLNVDYPVAPVVYEGATYDWTGFYVGVFGGVAGGEFLWDVPQQDGEIDLLAGGLFGGLQIGADYQIDNFVVGIVADIAAHSLEGGIRIRQGGAAAEITSKLEYLGTVRGRLGYAMDEFLLYAHGGYAFGHTSSTATGTALDDGDHHGYQVGVGFEYALTDMISLQTEYAYTNLGEATIFTDGRNDINSSLDFHSVKAGVNFRF